MFKSTIQLLCISFLFAQGQQDTLIKYFPTDIQRSEILNEEADEKAVMGKPHFRSQYNTQGELIDIQYIPGNMKLQEKLSQLKLYYGQWDAASRNLADGLTRDQLDGRNYYEVSFNAAGKIKQVTYFNESNRKLWSYIFQWNKEGTQSRYEIEFHVREPLTLFDEFLFSDQLCEMRPGWTAAVLERDDHRPYSYVIKDELGQIYYFYTLKYMTGNKQSGELILAEYFRSDSSKAGMHKLFYKSNDFLHRVEYFNAKDSLEKTINYDYTQAPREILLTATTNGGKLLEKRYIPFSQKYKRSPGILKDQTSLADVLEFVDNSSIENIQELSKLIEAKFKISVSFDEKAAQETKTESLKPSPQEEIKSKEVTEIKSKAKKEQNKPREKFAIGLNAGNQLVSGNYFSGNNVFNFGSDLQLPLKFNLFWFSLKPAIGFGSVYFHGNESAFTSWLILRSNNILPGTLPIVLESALGTAGPGFGIKGGVLYTFDFGIETSLGLNAVLLTNIDSKGELTGYFSAELGFRYTLPF